jgi:polyisoprenoid-binding protein YceI
MRRISAVIPDFAEMAVMPGSSGVIEILASFTLLTNKYPHITFRSTSINGQSGAFTIKGDLTITGTSRPISLAVTVGGDGQVTVQTSVVQTQFRIKPYSAMLGTLKISEEVEVRATLMLPTYLFGLSLS